MLVPVNINREGRYREFRNNNIVLCIKKKNPPESYQPQALEYTVTKCQIK